MLLLGTLLELELLDFLGEQQLLRLEFSEKGVILQSFCFDGLGEQLHLLLLGVSILDYLFELL